MDVTSGNEDWRNIEGDVSRVAGLDVIVTSDTRRDEWRKALSWRSPIPKGV
jgi:hypothetical protein